LPSIIASREEGLSVFERDHEHVPRARVCGNLPHVLKAAFGRGRLRAGSLRSPVLAGQHQGEHEPRSTQPATATSCGSESE
jgi:hypothetical protein